MQGEISDQMAEGDDEEWASFLRAAPPPSNLSRARDEVATFVARQQSSGRNVAFIAVSFYWPLSLYRSFSLSLSLSLHQSGGTSVPLEKNTVRFLDNFSSGGRGSSSAEYPNTGVAVSPEFLSVFTRIKFPRMFYPTRIKFPGMFYPTRIKFTRMFYPTWIKFTRMFYPTRIKFTRMFYPTRIKFPGMFYPTLIKFPGIPR